MGRDRAADAATLNAAATILGRVDRREPWHRCTCGHDRTDHIGGHCWGWQTCDCRRFKLDTIDAVSPETGRLIRRLEELARELTGEPASQQAD